MGGQNVSGPNGGVDVGQHHLAVRRPVGPGQAMVLDGAQRPARQHRVGEGQAVAEANLADRGVQASPGRQHVGLVGTALLDPHLLQSRRGRVARRRGPRRSPPGARPTARSATRGSSSSPAARSTSEARRHRGASPGVGLLPRRRDTAHRRCRAARLSPGHVGRGARQVALDQRGVQGQAAVHRVATPCSLTTSAARRPRAAPPWMCPRGSASRHGAAVQSRDNDGVADARRADRPLRRPTASG